MRKHLYSEKGVHDLQTAFIELINQKSYSSISILEIAKKAGLNRTTFYLFYSNKAELVRDICDTFLDEFIGTLIKSIGNNSSETKKSTKHAFYHLKQHKKMLLGLWSIQEIHFSPYIEMQEAIKKSVLNYLDKYHLKVANNGSADFFAELYAANVMATVKWWLHNEEGFSFDYIYDSINICSEQGILHLLE